MIERERDIQRQIENNRIRDTRYNKKYKDRDIIRPRYLIGKNLDNMLSGDGVRALVKIRCSNLEEANKYWLGEESKKCIFCEEGQDSIELYKGMWGGESLVYYAV